MKAKKIYIIVLCIICFIEFLILYELYERNFLTEKKLYKAIIFEKYINYNTDGDSYMFKLKFKWQEDTITDEGYVNKKEYDTYKTNDTMLVYYNLNATTTKIIFANTLQRFNQGSTITISCLFLVLLFLVYKIKTAKDDDYFFMEDN